MYLGAVVGSVLNVKLNLTICWALAVFEHSQSKYGNKG